MAATAVLANDKAVAFGCSGSHEMDGMWMAGATHPSCSQDGHGTEVFAAIELVGYTADTFNATMQAAFKKGIAALTQVNAGEVHINMMTDHVHAHRRQLLEAHSGNAVEIEFSVKAFTADSVTSVTKALTDATPAAMKTGLETAGLAMIVEVEVLMAPAHGTEVFSMIEIVGYTSSVFTEETKGKFKMGIAALMASVGVAATDVQIVDIKTAPGRASGEHDHRRRQLLAGQSALAVEVIFSVKVMDAAAAATLITALTAVTEELMAAGLRNGGFSDVIKVERLMAPIHGMPLYMSLELVGFNVEVFTDTMKGNFKSAFAAIADVNAADAHILKVADHEHAHRRQLLAAHSGNAVEVDLSVKSMNAVAATSFLNLNVTEEIMKTKFKAAGLDMLLEVEFIMKPSAEKRKAPVAPVPAAIEDADANGEVFVTLELVGYSKATFNAGAQTQFKKGIATLANVNPLDVRIGQVTDEAHDHTAHKRHLLEGHDEDAILVEFSIKVKDAFAETALVAALRGATTKQMTTALKAAGLDNLVEITVNTAPSNEAPVDMSVSGAYSVKSLISSVVVVFGVIASLA
jgi:3-isopropylmalate dehydratase small subunit